jgi:anti-sigma-K factor RskA
VSDERHDATARNGDCNGNAAPYVLGALPEGEYQEFVAHLETCSVCREEVASLQTVAAALPAAVPQHRAPAPVKQRVMGDVSADARRRALTAGEPAAAALRLGRPRWRPLLAPVAVGLAVLALLAVVLASSGGGGTKVVRAQVLAPGASGYVRVSGGRAELTLSGMPQTTPGRVYEVWVKTTGAPKPTDALFTVTSAGRATVGVPGGVAGVRDVLVTSEPAGGSPAPTRKPIVVAALS